MNDDPVQQNQRTFKQADVRLLILQFLCQQPSYMANQEVLLFALREHGHAISHEHLYIELSWLDQVANVLVDKLVGELHVAILNTAGLDVVEGSRVIPGIRYPLPHEIHQR
jgi:hypothetical protein